MSGPGQPVLPTVKPPLPPKPRKQQRDTTGSVVSADGSERGSAASASERGSVASTNNATEERNSLAVERSRESDRNARRKSLAYTPEDEDDETGNTMRHVASRLSAFAATKPARKSAEATDEENNKPKATTSTTSSSTTSTTEKTGGSGGKMRLSTSLGSVPRVSPLKSSVASTALDDSALPRHSAAARMNNDNSAGNNNNNTNNANLAPSKANPPHIVVSSSSRGRSASSSAAAAGGPAESSSTSPGGSVVSSPGRDGARSPASPGSGRDGSRSPVSPNPTRAEIKEHKKRLIQELHVVFPDLKRSEVSDAVDRHHAAEENNAYRLAFEELLRLREAHKQRELDSMQVSSPGGFSHVASGATGLIALSKAAPADIVLGRASGTAGGPGVRKALVLYDYRGKEPGELTITAGSLIFVTETNNDGWFTGFTGESLKKPDAMGVFPGNRVKFL